MFYDRFDSDLDKPARLIGIQFQSLDDHGNGASWRLRNGYQLCSHILAMFTFAYLVRMLSDDVVLA